MNTKNSGQWSVASGQSTEDNDASRVASLQPPASSLRPANSDQWSVASGQVTEDNAASRVPTSGLQPPASGLQPAASRRGVLLLVVLSLLVLFTLIGVTFVLVASQSRRATRADSRHEQYGDDPRRVVDAVFSQIVRDTTNPRSSLQGHSLLADMYGNDGVKIVDGAPMAVTAVGAGQFLQFVTNAGPTTATFPEVALGAAPQPILNCPLSEPQVQTPGFFNGCVLTFLDGPAANVSTRIVGWEYTGFYRIQVMAIEGFDAASLDLTTRGILINGRPFNGTGFGFNRLAITNTAQTLLTRTQPFTTLPQTDVPYALLPNFRSANNSLALFSSTGGGDEDYDAADPQNILLGYLPIAPPGPPPGPTDILPSAHRPDLIRFNTNTYAAVWADPSPPMAPTLLRRSMLRPMGPMLIDAAALPFPAAQIDHPNFTGSNPNFDAVRGPWDVDNDGDGVAESVWIDVGMPVQTAPDGRRFKPLAAILCLDMDGRLNVNAHGNLAQANPNYSTAIFPGTAANLTIADQVFDATPPAQITLPRGSGYGPPEINLGLDPPNNIFVTPSIDYPNFFRGRPVGARTYEGRYGEYGAGGGSTIPFPQPGGTAAPLADNNLDWIKRFDFPNNYYTSIPTSYGTPADLWGRAVLGIDYAGQPIYSFLQQSTAMQNGVIAAADPDLPNDPYALNLSSRRIRSAAGSVPPTDSAFTVAELERILRRFDVDAQALPDRLRALLDPNDTRTIDLGRIVTTDSNDLPSPGILPTKDMATLLKNQNQVANSIPSGLHLVDLLRARLIEQSGYPLPLTPLQQTTIETMLAPMVNPLNANRILAPELVAGQRFDLNRPFGNGQDDNGDLTVDEPGEYNPNREAPARWNTAQTFGASVPLDLNNDDLFDNNDMLARQQYAKYLYVLMMIFADHDYLWAQDNGANVAPAIQRELTARRIAQWAVNAVDFRDPDSIMTPFEYDVNPFNLDGWSVDGNIGTNEGVADRRVVWGCEYPDLLITETMALHDRRVRDSEFDDAEQGPQNNRADVVNNMMPDADYDQARVPQGSVFFELFCPRNGNASQRVYSGDLYTGGQLDLGKMAPPTAGAPYPVWRIAITASRVSGAGQPNDVNARMLLHPDTANFDPVSAGTDPLSYSVFNLANTTPAPVTIERIVWFANQFPGGNPEANIIYYNRGAMPTLLSPGRHALIGPRSVTAVGKAGAAGLANQRIRLSPTVEIFNTAAQPYYSTNSIAPPLPIICASPVYPAPLIGVPWDATVAPEYIGVSVTEPLFSSPNYYRNPGTVNLAYTPPTPLDLPLDSKPGTPLGDDKATGLPLILNTGTTPNYKTALLQRLADPLSAFDVVTNPYITVDWQPIDLTVFNGESLQTTTPGHHDIDDLPFQNPPPLVPLSPGVGSRERGSATPTEANVWNSQPQQATSINSPKGNTIAIFDYELIHSLGYLNKALGSVWTTPPPNQAGYAGAPNPTIAGANTFPWLTWNNRPFVSNMELLQVPATSAEQLVRQFSSLPTAGPDPYDAVSPANFHVPCKHLLNFFMSSQNGNAGAAPYFYRALDYLHVPSRFVGTETYLKPNTAPSGFYPPFNKVSNYRDPGRVNINTIPSPPGPPVNNPIWNAVLNGGLVPPWSQIVASRRGEIAAASVLAPQSVASPSVFSHPFRTAGGASFGLPGAPPVTAEVDATLMRRAPGQTHPLFQYQNAGIPYVNPDRNSYFRYMPLQRLSNLLTTRSNVYAVWVTVGFFEVSPVPVDPIRYPDGFTLGQEIGSETGEIKRPRAFYIYDRSIPVGFEPGKDHNIEQGTLIKRFIE